MGVGGTGVGVGGTGVGVGGMAVDVGVGGMGVGVGRTAVGVGGTGVDVGVGGMGVAVGASWVGVAGTGVDVGAMGVGVGGGGGGVQAASGKARQMIVSTRQMVGFLILLLLRNLDTVKRAPRACVAAAESVLRLWWAVFIYVVGFVDHQRSMRVSKWSQIFSVP